jgi:hypothetical protein
MKVELLDDECVVTRQPGIDPYFYDDAPMQARGELALLYRVARELNRLHGADVKVVKMVADGHRVSANQYYIRSLSPDSRRPHIAVYNPNFLTTGANETFNNEGVVRLRVMRNIFEEAQTGAAHQSG